MLKWGVRKQEQRWLRAAIIRAVEKELGMKVDMTNDKVVTKYNEIMTEILGDFAIGIPPTYEKGGRVGYQTAGSVQDPILQQEAAAVQDAGMPEELTGITFDELRARLPQEVSDEIVRLLANSAEALEDFATIQTEQDIANFNKKYGVNLVLPSEA